MARVQLPLMLDQVSGEKSCVAMMTTERSAGVTLEMKLKNKSHPGDTVLMPGRVSILDLNSGAYITRSPKQRSQKRLLSFNFFEKKCLFVSDAAFTVSITPWERNFYVVFALQLVESKVKRSFRVSV